MTNSKRELAELREAIYRIMSEKDGAEENKDEDPGEIKFPYTDLPAGIICFGGYDQWRNRMQENFPGVRFVPAGYRYDSNIVRKAPCIWVHSGYISHKMYNRIIGDARAADVDIHYFNSHSVISSAKLLVESMGNQNGER